MATAFTHGFAGLVLAPLAPRDVPRVPLVAALVVLPILPDLDVIAFPLGVPYGHPLGHRGFTHSFFFALVLGYATALLFSASVKPLSRRWLGLGLVLSLAVASHGVLDALTDAGRGIAFLWPFDDTRYFSPWRPMATSPIGLRFFSSGRAATILQSELVWVWLPGTAASLLLFWVRRAFNAARDRSAARSGGYASRHM